MKLTFGIIAVVLIANVLADVSHVVSPSNDYLPSHDHHHTDHKSHEGHAHHSHHETGTHAHQGHQTHGDEESNGLGRDLEENDAVVVENEELPSEVENEAVPAHSLRADGYHYKVPEGNRFFY